MYARVATWEGADPSRFDQVIEGVRQQIDSGMESAPPGLEGLAEVWMLVDRKSGKGLGITLFETDEDLRRGDEALNAMSPPETEGAGTRVGVDLYEVALRRERGQTSASS